MKVQNDLLTEKYTELHCEDKMLYGAPHHFHVRDKEGNVLQHIDFQCGPILEKGLNGVMNEDVLVMVLSRLQHFQQTDFSCKENAMAITKIEEALLWLRKRTMGRENRGVEGTHKV